MKRSTGRNAIIRELCQTNEFLIEQNARLLAKNQTSKARLQVAIATLTGCVFAIISILFIDL